MGKAGEAFSGTAGQRFQAYAERLAQRREPSSIAALRLIPARLLLRSPASPDAPFL